MRIHALLLLAFAGLAATGCRSSMEEVYASKTKGRSAVYPVTVQKAWEVSGDVLWEATREYPETHPENHFMCTKGGMGTDVTFIGVWCEPVDDPAKARVTVVTRRLSGLQFETILNEAQFHENFAVAAGVKRQP